MLNWRRRMEKFRTKLAPKDPVVEHSHEAKKKKGRKIGQDVFKIDMKTCVRGALGMEV